MNEQIHQAQHTSYKEAVEGLSASGRAILDLLRFGPFPAAHMATLLPAVPLGTDEIIIHLRQLVSMALVQVELTDRTGTATHIPHYHAIPASAAKPKLASKGPVLAGLEKEFLHIRRECRSLEVQCQEWQEYCQNLENRLARLFELLPEVEQVWTGI